MRTIGLIGLGLMGTALAQRFLRQGMSVVGYDLFATRLLELANAGGLATSSAIDVARNCDALLLSLPDSGVVAAVIDSVEPALRAGQLVIDTTTGEPLQSAALGRKLAEREIQFVDATIAGSSAQAAAGQVIVMVGGQEDAFREALPLLRYFAAEVFHVGPWGSGSTMKLVVNLVLGLNRAVLAEALTFAKSLGLEPQSALAILKASPARSEVMETKGAKMLAEDFSPQAKLSQHLKDVRLILAAGERTGALLPLSRVHRELLARAEAAGYGELDNSAIVRAFADPVQSRGSQ